MGSVSGACVPKVPADGIAITKEDVHFDLDATGTTAIARQVHFSSLWRCASRRCTCPAIHTTRSQHFCHLSVGIPSVALRSCSGESTPAETRHARLDRSPPPLERPPFGRTTALSRPATHRHAPPRPAAPRHAPPRALRLADCRPHPGTKRGRTSSNALSLVNAGVKVGLGEMKRLLQTVTHATAEHTVVLEDVGTDGRVLHVAVADLRVGGWHAPYSYLRWHRGDLRSFRGGSLAPVCIRFVFLSM